MPFARERFQRFDVKQMRDTFVWSVNSQMRSAAVCLSLPLLSFPSSCFAVNPLHRGCCWRFKFEARARLRLYLVAHAGHESKHSHPRCPLPVEGGTEESAVTVEGGVCALVTFHLCRHACVYLTTLTWSRSWMWNCCCCVDVVVAVAAVCHFWGCRKGVTTSGYTLLSVSLSLSLSFAHYIALKLHYVALPSPSSSALASTDS